ncbi:hypothetical protein [Erythrobacter sp.]
MKLHWMCTFAIAGLSALGTNACGENDPNVHVIAKADAMAALNNAARSFKLPEAKEEGKVAIVGLENDLFRVDVRYNSSEKGTHACKLRVQEIDDSSSRIVPMCIQRKSEASKLKAQASKIHISEFAAAVIEQREIDVAALHSRLNELPINIANGFVSEADYSDTPQTDPTTGWADSEASSEDLSDDWGN